jgi:hypothetical protein
MIDGDGVQTFHLCIACWSGSYTCCSCPGSIRYIYIYHHHLNLSISSSSSSSYSVLSVVPGFISIACGLPANFSFTETKTGINYTSDATYIDTGISKSISHELGGSQQRYVWNLRSFPQGIRNCYTINVTAGTKYLIRATFLHGNYDGNDDLPQFDLYFGANTWETVKVVNSSVSVIKELIHVPSLDYIHVCLVNSGLGTPFISAIELRPLINESYVTESGSLALYWRADVGLKANLGYR